MQKQTKPEPLGKSMAKLVLVVSFIVGIGAVLGILGYALTKQKPAVKKPVLVLATDCKTDLDCSSYLSYNTCQVFCANNNKENQKIINKLEKTCDSSLWYASAIDCQCVNNKCELKTEAKKCKRHGEIPNYIPGEDMSIQCCDGLVHRTQKQWYDNDCNNLFEMRGAGGYAGICLACGDGKCDVNYENNCNCPEDCGEKIDTSNWQTYRNEEYGFEVKYPLDYSEPKTCQTETGPCIVSDNISVQFDDMTGYSAVPYKGKELEINGIKLVEFPLGGNRDGGLEFELGINDFPAKNKYFRILFNTDKPGLEYKIAEFRQILSTFKFIEK